MPVVLYEKHDHTVIITLNRPEVMNAINQDVRREFHEAMVRFRDDNDARTAIVTGAGDRSFSAGADLREMSSRQVKGGGPSPFWEGTPAVMMRKLEVWKPVIAAVNGYCIAGGLELALACDIRIVSETASFALTEATLGIIPGNAGTQLLPRTVPVGRALEIMFTGERIDAQEAYRIGLVNRVVPLSELMPAAEELAQRINESAPISVRFVKEVALKGLDLPLMDGLRMESLFSTAIHMTEDAREGPLAFVEKRKPVYKGR